MKGKIYSINIAFEKKGDKVRIGTGKLLKDIGLKDDSYNKPGDRQITLASVEKIKEQSFCPRVNMKIKDSLSAGDFSETLTVEGIDFEKISIGDTFKIGETAEIEITKVGMTCYKFCPIGKEQGQCPLPTYFLFAKILESGIIITGNPIEKI